jgi:galactonate dehydratase
MTGPRIAGATTTIVDAYDRSWVFVKVETDEPGLHGWGEASVGWQARAVAAQVEDLAVLLVGEECSRIEHLWQTMYRQLFYKGGVVTMSALAGLDQALWDIRGKVLGQPLYELLGGRVRDRVRVYDHLMRWTLELDWAMPSAWAEAARMSVDDGFDAVKIYPVPPGRPLEGAAALREAVAFTSAVREAVGDDVDIMVDLHGRTTPAMAIQYAVALEPIRPLFLEEPCQPENVDAMVEVARAVRTPIATGERLLSRWEFRQLLERRACAVVQPDVCHCGGVSELRRIAAMAETYYVAVAPHNPVGPIGTMVTLHLALAMPNFLIMEQLRGDVGWRDEIVDEPPRIEAGHMLPPTRPGIGIELLEDVAAAHPFTPRAVYRSYAPDGSVVDD